MTERRQQFLFLDTQTPQARFVIAGALAALINWIARFLFELFIPFAAAVLVAMVIGMTCGFLLYDRWVFPGSARPLFRKVRDFLAINLISQGVMFLVALIGREFMILAGFEQLFSGAVAHLVGIGLGAVISFLGHRSITYRGSLPRDDPE